MKYMLLITWDERAGLARAASADEAEVKEHGAFVEALGARLLEGARLRPTSEATRVQVRAGKPSVTDGPFTETKEALGGYYVIECADRAEALQWAARCPSAKHGTVEIRPLWVM
jgi:hypothetical protein